MAPWLQWPMARRSTTGVPRRASAAMTASFSPVASIIEAAMSSVVPAAEAR